MTEEGVIPNKVREQYLNEYFGEQLIWVRLAIEALGIFIFSFGILTCGGELWRIANALAGAIVISGDFTGAHLNPAITFMLVCCPATKLKFRIGFMYWMAQLTGTYLSLLVYYLMFGNKFSITEPPANLTGADSLRCFVSEGMGFFILGYAVLLQSSPRTRVTKDKFLTAIFVALMLLFGIEISGLSGSFINPGISTGYFTFFTFWYGNSEFLNQMWVYIAGPFLGGGLAGYFYWVNYYYILKPTLAELKEKSSEILGTQEQPPKNNHTYIEMADRKMQASRRAPNETKASTKMSYSTPNNQGYHPSGFQTNQYVAPNAYYPNQPHYQNAQYEESQAPSELVFELK